MLDHEISYLTYICRFAAPVDVFGSFASVRVLGGKRHDATLRTVAKLRRKALSPICLVEYRLGNDQPFPEWCIVHIINRSFRYM